MARRGLAAKKVKGVEDWNACCATDQPDASFLERPVLECHDQPSIDTQADTQKNTVTKVTLVAGGDDGVAELARVMVDPYDEPNSLGKLGDYEVIRVVGRGGMGVVYEAIDAKLQRRVALKVLAQEYCDHASARTRFLQEAHAVAVASAPNIVTIHRIHDGENPLIVMELVQGSSLRDHISHPGSIDETQIIQWAFQIANGLAAAHKRGLIHRDIKPGNILIESETKRVKITDFGLARLADQVGLTRTGELAGTPQYMSPEQAMASKDIDQRTDLFSFGTTLYAMCTGIPPFRGQNVVATLRQICQQPHRPVRDLNPQISPWLADLIDKLLAKDPADRFQTASEVSELLKQFAAHLAQPNSVEPPSLQHVKDATNTQRPALQRAVPRSIATLLCVLVAIVVFEVVGLTHIAATISGLAAGKGTLVIEVDDPAVEVSVDGVAGKVDWDGSDLHLQAGDYLVSAVKDGKQVQHKVVAINRNERQLFRVSAKVESITHNNHQREEVQWNIIPSSAGDPPPLAAVPFDAEQAKSHQQAWADYLNVPVQYTNEIGMKFRLIPPGEFLMGVTYEQLQSLKSVFPEPELFALVKAVSPAHPVRISRPFYLGKEEVTYEEIRRITGRDLHLEDMPPGHKALGRDAPARRYCTWGMCLTFCNELSRLEGLEPHYVGHGDQVVWAGNGIGYRLPTEAEWEFACRGGTASIRFCDANTECNVDSTSRERVAEIYEWLQPYRFDNSVPPRLANPFGLIGLYGSGSEWCWDFHGNSSYNSRPLDSVTLDPCGPSTGTTHVARGGNSTAQFSKRALLLSSVVRIGPNAGHKWMGFGRVVLEVKGVQEMLAKSASASVPASVDHRENSPNSPLGGHDETDSPEEPTQEAELIQQDGMGSQARKAKARSNPVSAPRPPCSNQLA